MTIRILVFDCDGVLLDSVGVKREAFAHVARPYGEEAVRAILSYHDQNGGVSRYKKFAWFFEEILGRSITQEESEAWNAKFVEFSQKKLRSCELIPGALETLRYWQGKMPLYVCSGAPCEEQRSILRAHGLESYFTGIYGTPPAKEKLLGQIIEHAHIAPSEALMIGDASTDLLAAKENGTLFYGIGEAMQSDMYPWSSNLTDFTHTLQTMLISR